jgi:hypothetical protein
MKKKATAKTISEVLKIFHVITKNADNIGTRNRAVLSATCRQLSAKTLILFLWLCVNIIYFTSLYNTLYNRKTVKI